MEKDLIQSLLAQVFSQLTAASEAEQKKPDEGMLQFARTLPYQQGETVFPDKLNLQSSDLFFQNKRNHPTKPILEVKGFYLGRYSFQSEGRSWKWSFCLWLWILSKTSLSQSNV